MHLPELLPPRRNPGYAEIAAPSRPNPQAFDFVEPLPAKLRASLLVLTPDLTIEDVTPEYLASTLL